MPYHDQKQTGDLISRVTGDIDAIQSFIASGLLGALVNGLTLVGMVGVMLYINWRFTLIALSVLPPLAILAWSGIGKSLSGHYLATPFGVDRNVWQLLLSLPVLYAARGFFTGAAAAGSS